MIVSAFEWFCFALLFVPVHVFDSCPCSCLWLCASVCGRGCGGGCGSGSGCVFVLAFVCVLQPGT
eukprot:277567-Alexandrium_andersonii.AAC.1